jgi:Holliday junction DNA helicase RuvB
VSSQTHDPLRPETLADFAGQPEVSAELEVILGAAKSRGELPPHLLFSGPQGLGKTTLSYIIAREVGVPLVTTSGPMLDKPGDLAALLINITEPTVLFIDEIHRMPMAVEETIYTAMEDGRLDIVLAEGSRKARTIAMPLEPFVLVGATTRLGLLGGPFRDRFGHKAKLKAYDTATLTSIVLRNAALLGDEISVEAAQMVAERSRGTPRIANHLLRRVRDFSHHSGSSTLGVEDAAKALELFGVDALGLDATDRELLTALCVQFDGRPVGISALASAIGETQGTVEDVNEPYLLRQGMLVRTPRGRAATRRAYEHLGLPVPAALVVEETLTL